MGVDPGAGKINDARGIATRSEVAAINASAIFNSWAGFEVLAAGDGCAELKLAWRPELGQYAGFLHAALIGGMIDTACGFAACTDSGRVLASHFSVAASPLPSATRSSPGRVSSRRGDGRCSRMPTCSR